MMPRRAFIAGCQRSGTTLLRLALEAHRRIAGVDEQEAYKWLLSSDTSGAAARDLPHADWLVFKVPRFSEQLLWANLLDPDYGQFANFYRREPVVFLVRDPRDVVSSMMALRVAEGEASWLKRYAPPMVESRLARDGAEKHEVLVAALSASSWAPHVVGAVYWVLKNAALLDYRREELPVKLVGYEQLVAQPEAELRRIVEFLDLPWDEALLAHQTTEHDQLRPDGRTIGLSDPATPIHSRSVGRFRRDLTDAEASEIMDIASALWHSLRRLAAGEGGQRRCPSSERNIPE